MRNIIICLAPLVVLLACIAIACLLGFALLMGLGDVLSIERMVNKGTQLFLVLSLLPLMSLMKLQWQAIGFNGKALFYRQLMQGFALGILILGPIILVLYGLDIRVLKIDKIWTLGLLLKTLFGSLLTALLISLLEEPVFRGLLLSFINRHMGRVLAILLGAFYYAGLHFLKTDLEVPYQQLQWFSAFELVADALLNPFKMAHLQAFLALFMVGVFLGIARLQVGLGLGFCIGCHTGWVFLIKLTKSMSNVNTHADYFYLVSAYDGVIGPLVSVWLIMTVIIYYFLKWQKIH